MQLKPIASFVSLVFTANVVMVRYLLVQVDQKNYAPAMARRYLNPWTQRQGKCQQLS